MKKNNAFPRIPKYPMSNGTDPTFSVWDNTTISIANNLMKSKTTNLSFLISLIYFTTNSIALKYNKYYPVFQKYSVFDQT